MTDIGKHFSEIPDFREGHKCKHLLSDILTIGLCTYLSNGQDYEDMVIFGQTKGKLLPELLELPNGIPSHDTFNRVFQILDCEILKECLTKHGRELLDVLAEKQICLDGKKLRGQSPQSRGNKGLYIVNAWVSENRLCIGQQKVCDKTGPPVRQRDRRNTGATQRAGHNRGGGDGGRNRLPEKHCPPNHGAKGPLPSGGEAKPPRAFRGGFLRFQGQQARRC